jgi:hypothetical protein
MNLRKALTRIGQRLAPDPVRLVQAFGWIGLNPEYGNLEYHRSRYTPTGKVRMKALAADQRRARQAGGPGETEHDDGCGYGDVPGCAYQQEEMERSEWRWASSNGAEEQAGAGDDD